MKRTFEFLNRERTKARVTERPGWVARLFGASARTTECHWNGVYWAYAVDEGHVGISISDRISEARRWEEVHELPEARLQERS